MTFEIQYSKNAKFISKTISKLSEEDAAKFKFMLALKVKELQTPEITYKIK